MPPRKVKDEPPPPPLTPEAAASFQEITGGEPEPKPAAEPKYLARDLTPPPPLSELELSITWHHGAIDATFTKRVRVTPRSTLEQDAEYDKLALQLSYHHDQWSLRHLPRGGK